MGFLVAPVIAPGALGGGTQPTISGWGVALRPWRDPDAADLVTAYSDDAIRRWHALTLDRQEAAETIERWRAAWRSETAAGWAVVDNQDHVLGRVGFRVYAPRRRGRRARLLDHAARGQGVWHGRRRGPRRARLPDGVPSARPHALHGQSGVVQGRDGHRLRRGADAALRRAARGRLARHAPARQYQQRPGARAHAPSDVVTRRRPVPRPPGSRSGHLGVLHHVEVVTDGKVHHEPQGRDTTPRQLGRSGCGASKHTRRTGSRCGW